jgi:DNA-binding NtrC family response regulator
MGISNPANTLCKVEPLYPREANALAIEPADCLVGPSAAMTQLRGQIRRIAPYFRTALLTGEPGCGEQAVAHMLHQLSPRSQEPFLEIAPAEAETLLAMENSFSALTKFGLLYVQQPERLSRAAQRTLLRLLRERGALAPRIVAFAERGLRPLVSAGGFAPELADALGALRITLPPLRERREDIPDLLTHMVHTIAAGCGIVPPELAPDLLEAVMRAPWTGNFPKLQSAVEGLMEHAAKPVLHSDDLTHILGALPTAPQLERQYTPMVSLDTVIQDHIRAVLFACNGNKLRSAEILGISRSTLYRMLETQTSTHLSFAPKRLQMAG